jgi:hypothetical protein
VGDSRQEIVANSNNLEQFMSPVGPGKHVALFYENSDQARKIEFAFLEAGLRKGDSALYASTEDEPGQVLDAMRTCGIDVSRHLKSGKLHVHKVSNPALDPKGAQEGLEEFLRTTKSAKADPLRQVTRLFELSSEEEVKNSIEIERVVEKSVEGTQDSAVCSFCMKGEIHPSFDVWLTEMIRDHHGSVFVPKNSEGIAFYLK